MLMPALAAGLWGGAGGGGDGKLDGTGGEADGGGGDEDLDGDDEEEGDGDDADVSAVVASIVEEAASVDDAGAVLLEPLSSDANSLRPHVCGWTASFDVIPKGGVLALSSFAKFSTCMWQMPVFAYSL